MRQEIKKKVFCLGFQKSGTTTIKRCLEHLGYKVTGPDFVYDRITDKAFFKKAPRVLKKYDGFQDSPWPIYYRYLDVMVPDAKFILTERDPDQWLNSILSHFSGTWTPLRQRIYGIGDPGQCPELYKKKYIQHNENVKNYFKGREDKLLTLNLEEFRDWGPLCRFLDVSAPSIDIPKANSRSDREVYQNSVRGRLARMLHDFRLRQ